MPPATYRDLGHNPAMSSRETHDCHRRMAAELFNRTWELLELEERTAEQDREMLSAAYGSRFHWRIVGGPTQFSVSDWQVSRVWSLLGDAVLAKEHGKLALEIAEANGLGPFYRGYAHEALARAAALAGDDEALSHHLAEAEELSLDIRKPNEAELLRDDLDTLKSA